MGPDHAEGEDQKERVRRKSKSEKIIGKGSLKREDHRGRIEEKGSKGQLEKVGMREPKGEGQRQREKGKCA